MAWPRTDLARLADVYVPVLRQGDAFPFQSIAQRGGEALRQRSPPVEDDEPGFDAVQSRQRRAGARLDPEVHHNAGPELGL
mmetsp:Transcript_51444/g.119562  ORF Transcript_51444/g.119562 Transcript_51444/m.119562 type:complete len:81 (-) Transcript_51444:101-343(-)